MPELPWVKWYPGNWLSEPGLGYCCPATRGIWIDAINAMMVSNTPEISGTLEQLSRVCRCNSAEIRAAIDEIKKCEIGEVREHNGNIIIRCRRIVRDFEIRELRRKAGFASATKRQHHPQQTVPTNRSTPSTSTSTSTSTSSVSGERKVKETIGGNGSQSEDIGPSTEPPPSHNGHNGDFEATDSTKVDRRKVDKWTESICQSYSRHGPIHSSLRERTRLNVVELVSMGIDPEKFDLLCDWCQHSKNPYKPKDPDSATNPENWTKWQQSMEDEIAKNTPHKRKRNQHAL